MDRYIRKLLSITVVKLKILIHLSFKERMGKSLFENRVKGHGAATK